MSIRAAAIFLIIFLLPVADASADITREFRAKRGFLVLENFQHSAGLTYQYSAHDADQQGADYQTNKFEESYRFLFAGAIMDRHLLNFQLNGDLWLQQIESSSDSQGSSSSSGSKYQYSLAGTAYDRRWYPINFHSSRTLNTVVNAFSPTYDSDSTSNGIEIYLQKGPVPTKFRYERYTMDISGGGYDSSSTSNTLTISGVNNYRDFSSSSFSGSWSKSDSDSQNVSQSSDTYSLGLSNFLIWGQDKKYSLNSQFNWLKTDSGGVPQQNATLNESFLAHLGKALDAEMTYRYLYNETTTLGGRDQAYSTNTLAASILHRLYQSLDSRVHGQISHSELPRGSEDMYSGSGSLTYKKKLPAYSILTVVLSGEHAVTDRQGDATSITVRDERHRVLQPGEVIALDIPGPLLPGSVTVRGFSTPPPLPSTPPDITFVEDTDYFVDYLLGQITWGAVIPPTSEILVTYVATIDPSLKYSTDTVSVSGNLAMLSGKYSLLGSYFNQSQNLISGLPQNSLIDTTIKRLRFQGRVESIIYGLDYEDYSAGPSQYQYAEGWCLYSHTAPLWSLTLQARDRYTKYDAVGATEGYGQNTLSASANYSRSLASGLLLSLATTYVNVQRDNKDSSDAISAKANLRARFNKLDINLTGQTSWRLYGEAETRNDYVRFDLVRYF